MTINEICRMLKGMLGQHEEAPGILRGDPAF